MTMPEMHHRLADLLGMSAAELAEPAREVWIIERLAGR